MSRISAFYTSLSLRHSGISLFDTFRVTVTLPITQFLGN